MTVLIGEPADLDVSHSAWREFVDGPWQAAIDVRDFIQRNYTSYMADDSFLAPATERTRALWEQLSELFVQERERGVLDVSQVPSSITAHAPGYIDRERELIVGLQTEAPLKRAIFPNGGWRMVESSLKNYGFAVDPQVRDVFTRYRKTHNDGVFDAYTPEIMRARRAHIV